MPHYVYEIPRGVAPNRRIGTFADYVDASGFARAERQRRAFEDETMVLVVHAANTEQADESAHVLRLRFEEVRQSRPAPVARVAQFVRTYGGEQPGTVAPGRSQLSLPSP